MSNFFPLPVNPFTLKKKNKKIYENILRLVKSLKFRFLALPWKHKIPALCGQYPRTTKFHAFPSVVFANQKTSSPTFTDIPGWNNQEYFR